MLIRGHYVIIEPNHLIEIAWGELGNPAMPPGSTRLVIRLSPTPSGTHLSLSHTGLAPAEATKHAIGWPHFIRRLAILAEGGDPGPDPFASK